MDFFVFASIGMPEIVFPSMRSSEMMSTCRIDMKRKFARNAFHANTMPIPGSAAASILPGRMIFSSNSRGVWGTCAMALNTCWNKPAARYGFAITAGVLYAAAYPPIGIGLLVFPALLGLLWALRGLVGTQARAVGFLFGMAAFGTSLSWLYHLFGWFCVVLWMVLAFFPAMFAEMQWRAVNRGLAGWRLAIFTAVNWSAWEFIRAEVFPLKFPWMTVGLAIGPHPLLPWIGVYGVGLVAVLFASCLVMQRRPWATGALWVIFFVAANLLQNHQRGGEGATAKPDAIRIAAVQLETVTIDEFIRATNELPDDVDWVVWPEYALPYDVRRVARDWDRLNTLVTERDIILTFGTRVDEADGWRNIALTLGPKGVLGEHTKVQTVHLFDDGIAGKEAAAFETPFGMVGTPICFDCDYEGVVRRMTRAGAHFIVSPVMDAAQWSARQHNQHAELFRIRACENRRWVFVSASSGISQVIDPHGRIHGRLDAMEQGTISGIILPESRLTFYTRHGWLIPRAVLVLGVIAWVILLRKWII